MNQRSSPGPTTGPHPSRTRRGGSDRSQVQATAAAGEADVSPRGRLQVQLWQLGGVRWMQSLWGRSPR